MRHALGVAQKVEEMALRKLSKMLGHVASGHSETNNKIARIGGQIQFLLGPDGVAVQRLEQGVESLNIHGFWIHRLLNLALQLRSPRVLREKVWEIRQHRHRKVLGSGDVHHVFYQRFILFENHVQRPPQTTD